MKALFSVTISPSVLIVRLVSPKDVFVGIVISTSAAVAALMMTRLTTIPSPREAKVSPSAQCVYAPVTCNATLAPCSPELGVELMSVAAEGATVNVKLKSVRLLVSVPLRPPVNAV